MAGLTRHESLSIGASTHIGTTRCSCFRPGLPMTDIAQAAFKVKSGRSFRLPSLTKFVEPDAVYFRENAKTFTETTVLVSWQWSKL